LPALGDAGFFFIGPRAGLLDLTLAPDAWCEAAHDSGAIGDCDLWRSGRDPWRRRDPHVGFYSLIKGLFAVAFISLGYVVSWLGKNLSHVFAETWDKHQEAELGGLKAFVGEQEAAHPPFRSPSLVAPVAERRLLCPGKCHPR